VIDIFLRTAVLSFLPISELRGGIPYALACGVRWYAAYPFAAAVNCLAAPAAWLFLATFHRLFWKLSGRRGFRWYRRLFAALVERSRKKLERGVAAWGALAVALFVAIPLPLTGAWTGVLGAWVLGLPRGKTFAAVVLGVLVSGAVVTLVCTLGIEAFAIFTKKVGP
jgi:uncharacterized membrane protein